MEIYNRRKPSQVQIGKVLLIIHVTLKLITTGRLSGQKNRRGVWDFSYIICVFVSGNFPWGRTL